MAEQNLFCLCSRCSRKLRSAAARRVGMGSTCCRKETGKTITQLLKELDEQEAAAGAGYTGIKKEPRSKARPSCRTSLLYLAPHQKSTGA